MGKGMESEGLTLRPLSLLLLSPLLPFPPIGLLTRARLNRQEIFEMKICLFLFLFLILYTPRPFSNKITLAKKHKSNYNHFLKQKKKTTADLPGGRVCIGFSSSNDFLTVFYIDTRWGAP